MTLQTLESFLGWCTAINVGLLILWLLFFILGHNLMYRMHSKLFKLSVEQFDAIHYAAMAFYKTVVIVFNLVPYLVIHWIR